MIETEIIKLQIVSTIKLFIAVYIIFIWIPKKIFPQEYIDNSLDRIMFNIIHMTAVITLVYPYFIFLKLFGVIFLILSFVAIKLLFAKFYYKKSIVPYVKEYYNGLIIGTLKILETPKTHITKFKREFSFKIAEFRARLSLENILLTINFLVIVGYSLYLRTYRGFISLVGAAPDMYAFYYWQNILKMNILVDNTAGAPYMWSGPVLVYTVNIFANLNSVILNNIFPVIFLTFTFFSIYYVLRRLIESDGQRTAGMFVALILFGIVLPSPWAEEIFGTVIETPNPELYSFYSFSFYYRPFIDPLTDRIAAELPFLFFWRFTTALPYEIAASFFFINLYFLIKMIETRSTLFILLYAETLAILFSIHGGVAIPLLSCSVLIFIYSLLTFKIGLKSLMKIAGTVFIATFVGNLWMVQVFFYEVVYVGAAAPFLDKLIDLVNPGGGAAIREVYGAPVDKKITWLITPSPWILVVLGTTALLFLTGIFWKRLRFYLISLAFLPIGVLFIYFAPSMGFPNIVNPSRLMVFMAYSFAAVFGVSYTVFIERSFLRPVFRGLYFKISMIIILLGSVVTIAVTPKWIDHEEFWRSIYHIEHKQFPA